MAFYGNPVLTQEGKPAYLEAQAGVKLEICEIIFGDGVMSDGQLAEDITDMINPRMHLTPVDFIKSQGVLTVRVDYTNEEITEPFPLRELGVRANVGEGDDVRNILYSYGYSGDLAEIIQPQSAGGLIIRTHDLKIAIGNAQNVTVVVDKSTAYVRTLDKATLEDIEAGTPNKWIDASMLQQSLSGAGGVAVQAPFTIPPTAWQPGTKYRYTHYANIYNEAISYAYQGLLFLDVACRIALQDEGIDIDGETLDGVLRLWCDKVPSIDVVGTYACLSEGGAGGSSGGSNYVLPVASPTQLGGVKATTEEDGTLIVTGAELDPDQVLTDASDMLDDIF